MVKTATQALRKLLASSLSAALLINLFSMPVGATSGPRPAAPDLFATEAINARLRDFPARFNRTGTSQQWSMAAGLLSFSGKVFEVSAEQVVRFHEWRHEVVGRRFGGVKTKSVEREANGLRGEVILAPSSERTSWQAQLAAHVGWLPDAILSGLLVTIPGLLVSIYGSGPWYVRVVVYIVAVLPLTPLVSAFAVSALHPRDRHVAHQLRTGLVSPTQALSLATEIPLPPRLNSEDIERQKQLIASRISPSDWGPLAQALNTGDGSGASDIVEEREAYADKHSGRQYAAGELEGAEVRDLSTYLPALGPKLKQERAKTVATVLQGHRAQQFLLGGGSAEGSVGLGSLYQIDLLKVVDYLTYRSNGASGDNAIDALEAIERLKEQSAIRESFEAAIKNPDERLALIGQIGDARRNIHAKNLPPLWALQILSYRLSLERLAREQRQDPTAAVRQATILLHVTDSSWAEFEKHLVKTNFLGFNPQNIYITFSRSYPGFKMGEAPGDLQPSQVVQSEWHAASVEGLVIPGKAYGITSTGTLLPMPYESLLEYLAGPAYPKVTTIRTHRVNDLSMLSPSKALDLDAQTFAAMESANGHQIVGEGVKDPGAHFGGFFLAHKDKKRSQGFILHGIQERGVKLRDLTVQASRELWPFNAFRFFYDVEGLRKLKINALPRRLWSDRNLLFARAYTEDLTQLDEVKLAGYKPNDTEQINDFKGYRDLPAALDSIATLLADPDFSQIALSIYPDLYGNDPIENHIGMGVISDPQQIKVARKLSRPPELGGLDQPQLFEHWTETMPGPTDELKREFLAELVEQDSRYPDVHPEGYLKGYLNGVSDLFRAFRRKIDPHAGKIPLPPPTREVEPFSDDFYRLESEGIEAASKTAFVLMAGGLGQRLGTKMIKLMLRLTLLDGNTYLDWYLNYILALQRRSNASHRAKGQTTKEHIPLFLMTSEDTHEQTMSMLSHRRYIRDPSKEQNGEIYLVKTVGEGEQAEQSVVIIGQQAAVPGVTKFLKFGLDPKNLFKLFTQPHGHGDVHSVLYRLGMVKRWISEGRTHTILFQDTNAQALFGMAASLAAAIEQKAHLAFVGAPRGPGEATGSLALYADDDVVEEIKAANGVEFNLEKGEVLWDKLRDKGVEPVEFSKQVASRSAELGRAATIENIEYTQLDGTLKMTVDPRGDAVDPKTGRSPFALNLNNIFLENNAYQEVLEKNKGALAEIIKPKPTGFSRAETQAQDAARNFAQLGKTCIVIGYTVRQFIFSTAKNKLESARINDQASILPEAMSTAEDEFLSTFRSAAEQAGNRFVGDLDSAVPVQEDARIAARRNTPWADYPSKLRGVRLLLGSIFLFSSRFFLPLGTLKDRFTGNTITDRSTVYLDADAENLAIRNSRIDGGLWIQLSDGVKLVMDGVTVVNEARSQFVEIPEKDPREADESIMTRGYDLEKANFDKALTIHLTEPGEYKMESDGILRKRQGDRWVEVRLNAPVRSPGAEALYLSPMMRRWGAPVAFLTGVFIEGLRAFGLAQWTQGNWAWMLGLGIAAAFLHSLGVFVLGADGAWRKVSLFDRKGLTGRQLIRHQIEALTLAFSSIAGAFVPAMLGSHWVVSLAGALLPHFVGQVATLLRADRALSNSLRQRALSIISRAA